MRAGYRVIIFRYAASLASSLGRDICHPLIAAVEIQISPLLVEQNGVRPAVIQRRQSIRAARIVIVSIGGRRAGNQGETDNRKFTHGIPQRNGPANNRAFMN